MIETVLNDRYVIEAELGRGGMGVVYRAQDTLLERPVAIKVVATGGLGTEGRARLLQEARAAARLNHPNIVAIHDVAEAKVPGQDEPISFIVMEMVEGVTLRQYKPQDLDETIKITIQICTALSNAHQQGIIHRDLKPENVTVSANDSVKLMDFGLARISGKTRLTRQGALLGTVSYLAPEVIMGQEAGPRSDLYAMGVMLYEMCAGRPPFEGADLTAVISQHLHAPVVPPSAYNEQITPALNELIISLLSKHPEDRPASAEAIRDTLEQIALTAPDPRSPISGPQLNRLVRGRMIGRETEFGEAVALWEKSAAGNGQFLLISGDPGIGKSRMVKELTAYVEISDGATLLGNCFAEERTPYGPIGQIVQTSLENGFDLQLPPPVLADLLTLAPELRLTYPDIPPNERLDPEAEQQRLFDSIVTWFGALTKDGRLLLVIDDAHWADSGSMALLRYLARRLSRRQALVVATYREVELNEALPFQEMLSELNRERLATRIKLSRLDKEQTRTLLSTLFAEEITPDLLDGIYRETEGNPFFVEEVCKALVESGDLYFEDGRWRRPDIEDLEIPQGIRVAIQSRLGKLSEDEQFALQQAALLGREFEFEMLVAISDFDENKLIDGLEKAEKAQLIEEVRRVGPGSQTVFTFTHALIHSTLLSNLSTLRRQRLQRAMALAIEDAYPDRRQELAQMLGRFFAEAGDGQKAVSYLLPAGDAARRLYAYDEAIEAYEQALLFLREQGDRQLAARTLMKLGLTYHNIFAFDQARKAYDEGFAEWQRAADTDVSDGAPKIPAPHPFRAVATSDPSTLDPSQSYDNWSMWYIDQLFSGLLQLTAEDELVPDVARSWEVLDGGRTYVFHLRDDVRWSDGQPVTAGDFEFAWKRALHPDNDQGLGDILTDISGAKAFRQSRLDDADGVGIKVSDNHTLEVSLGAPSSYFLQLMAIAISKPVPRHVVERYGPDWIKPQNIVTNGPFTLKAQVPGRSLLFERYDDYHGSFRGNLAWVDFKIVPGAAALELYEQEKIDILYPYHGMSFKDARRAIQLHPDEYISEPDPMTTYLAFDVTRPPFDDLRVRQALILATDRDTLANRLTQGLDFPARGGLVPPGVVGYAEGIALPYDPVMARQKLAEAGFPDGQGLPQVSGICGKWGGLPAITDHLATQWKTNLGLRASFEHMDASDLINRLENDLPNIWLRGWSADYPDPDSFLRIASWLQQTGWRNDDYIKLIEEARHIANQSQRMALYRQAEQILVDESPVMPLHYGRLHVLLKPWIPSLPASIISGNILKDVIIEPH